jgi:hypothetical protein
MIRYLLLTSQLTLVVQCPSLLWTGSSSWSDTYFSPASWLWLSNAHPYFGQVTAHDQMLASHWPVDIGCPMPILIGQVAAHDQILKFSLASWHWLSNSHPYFGQVAAHDQILYFSLASWHWLSNAHPYFRRVAAHDQILCFSLACWHWLPNTQPYFGQVASHYQILYFSLASWQWLSSLIG